MFGSKQCLVLPPRSRLVYHDSVCSLLLAAKQSHIRTGLKSGGSESDAVLGKTPLLRLQQYPIFHPTSSMLRHWPVSVWHEMTAIGSGRCHVLPPSSVPPSNRANNNGNDNVGPTRSGEATRRHGRIQPSLPCPTLRFLHRCQWARCSSSVISLVSHRPHAYSRSWSPVQDRRCRKWLSGRDLLPPHFPHTNTLEFFLCSAVL